VAPSKNPAQPEEVLKPARNSGLFYYLSSNVAGILREEIVAITKGGAVYKI
jgi:hypothetical protein